MSDKLKYSDRFHRIGNQMITDIRRLHSIVTRGKRYPGEGMTTSLVVTMGNLILNGETPFIGWLTPRVEDRFNIVSLYNKHVKGDLFPELPTLELRDATTYYIGNTTIVVTSNVNNIVGAAGNSVIIVDEFDIFPHMTLLQSKNTILFPPHELWT